MSERAARIKLRSSTVTVVVSLSLVLFMLGLAGWIMLNFNNLTSKIKEGFGFQIILKDNINDATIQKLRKELDASIFVKEAAYVSKDVAAEEMKKELGEDFISFLGENPIPPSINVKLNSAYVNNDSLDWIVKEITSMAGGKAVKEIAYQKVLLREMGANDNELKLVLLVLSLLLLVVAVGLINNTIQLSIYSKRFLLRTMYLVGATQGFIRRPFIVGGIKQGIIAGIFACILLSGFIIMLIKIFPAILEIQNQNQLLLLMLAVIGLGILISSVSSALAVRRYLRLKAEDLYF